MRAWGAVAAGLVLAVSGTAQARHRKASQVRQQHGIWSEQALLPRGRVAGPDLVPLVRATLPSVVSITTSQLAHEQDPASRIANAAGADAPDAVDHEVGSGFVIRPDGLILTNTHVVKNARSIRVTLFDLGAPEQLPAEVVGIDDASDVALLQVHADRPLRALPLGDSDQVQVGQWVVAQGNPFGLSHTVSAGIISYVGRDDVTPEGFNGFHDYLQTDTAINPGSSGGPLLDLQGRVVGIANSVNPTGQGIAFALPINLAKRVLPALVAQGSVPRSWLGLQVQDLTPDVAESFGVRGSGVMVADLDEKGPAARGGLHTGDVVLRFDGQRVRRAQQLRWLASDAPPDRAVSVEVLREGRRLKLRLWPQRAPQADPVRTAIEQLGAKFAPVDVPTARAANLPLPNGAQVLSLFNGPGLAAGLRPGDVVVGVGGKEIDSPEELSRVLLSARERPLELKIHRGPQVLDLQLSPLTAAR